jgi:hypothetical protein
MEILIGGLIIWNCCLQADVDKLKCQQIKLQTQNSLQEIEIIDNKTGIEWVEYDLDNLTQNLKINKSIK